MKLFARQKCRCQTWNFTSKFHFFTFFTFYRANKNVPKRNAFLFLPLFSPDGDILCKTACFAISLFALNISVLPLNRSIFPVLYWAILKVVFCRVRVLSVGYEVVTEISELSGKATSYKVKNGLLKMAFSDEPISNKIFQQTRSYEWRKWKMVVFCNSSEALLDSPSHVIYFWIYTYVRVHLQQWCVTHTYSS